MKKRIFIFIVGILIFTITIISADKVISQDFKETISTSYSGKALACYKDIKQWVRKNYHDKYADALVIPMLKPSKNVKDFSYDYLVIDGSEVLAFGPLSGRELFKNRKLICLEFPRKIMNNHKKLASVYHQIDDDGSYFSIPSNETCTNLKRYPEPLLDPPIYPKNKGSRLDGEVKLEIEKFLLKNIKDVAELPDNILSVVLSAVGITDKNEWKKRVFTNLDRSCSGFGTKEFQSEVEKILNSLKNESKERKPKKKQIVEQ